MELSTIGTEGTEDFKVKTSKCMAEQQKEQESIEAIMVHLFRYTQKHRQESKKRVHGERLHQKSQDIPFGPFGTCFGHPTGRVRFQVPLPTLTAARSDPRTARPGFPRRPGGVLKRPPDRLADAQVRIVRRVRTSGGSGRSRVPGLGLVSVWGGSTRTSVGLIPNTTCPAK